jgi:hypothetical protein
LPPLPLPTRVLETQLQSQPVTVIESIVSKVGSEKHQQHEVLDELKPASGDEAEEVNIELKPADESNAETSNQSEPITPPLPLVESSSIDQDMAEDIPLQNDDHFDFTIDDDGFNMDMDYDQEDNEVAR